MIPRNKRMRGVVGSCPSYPGGRIPLERTRQRQGCPVGPGRTSSSRWSRDDVGVVRRPRAHKKRTKRRNGRVGVGLVGDKFVRVGGSCLSLSAPQTEFAEVGFGFSQTRGFPLLRLRLGGQLEAGGADTSPGAFLFAHNGGEITARVTRWSRAPSRPLRNSESVYF
jgi:hypothetical protein